LSDDITAPRPPEDATSVGTDASWSQAPAPIGLGARLGRYELRALIGSGGMGMVFEAHDPELNRTVAVKVLHTTGDSDDRAARLRREGQTMARLTHANVVRVYDVGATRGQAFVAMEYVSGGTLRHWLERAPRHPAEIIAAFVDAGRGLAAAHDAGLVHRDFKPSNVLVGDDGRVLVTDFGIARGSDPALAHGDTSGTPAYMAPEQLAGRVVDARADQFSFCVGLWRALFGSPPFAGVTVAELAASTAADAVTSPPAAAAAVVSSTVRVALERGLRADPAARFASMPELLSALAAHGPRPLSSVAVLSFADLSATQDQAYLCDGVAEEILIALAQVDGLRVAARGSSFQLKSSAADPRLVGTRLGVEAVLEGSVRHAGDQLRVTVRLVDSADGSQRWSRRFDGPVADVFAIQDQIAVGVATAMRGILTASDQRSLRRPETTPEAYEHFLRGRAFVRNPTAHSMQLARKALERAIELDPSYAPAHATLAQLHAWLAEWYGGGDAARDVAEAASARALELGPELAESHVARAAALLMRRRYEEAVRAFERAIALDPRSFEAHYLCARACFQRGHDEDAVRLYLRAADLQVEDCQALILAAVPLNRLGRHGEADAVQREGLRRAERLLDLDPTNARALSLGATVHLELGDLERALDWIARATAIAPDDVAVNVCAACLFARAGAPEQALDALERCVGRGYGNRDWIAHDPDYDSLRHLPRFQSLLAKLA
jgi:TolB-like protein/Flp pilus assembly protein TadD/predicted Ser/Thr protein kinase